MTNHIAQPQLSDADRIAMLDKKVAVLTDGKYHNNQLESRQPFSAVIICQTKPITKWDHFWCLIVTLMSLGLGLVLWLIVIYLKRSERNVRRIRLEVTPSGQIVTTKLPNAGQQA